MKDWHNGAQIEGRNSSKLHRCNFVFGEMQ